MQLVELEQATKKKTCPKNVASMNIIIWHIVIKFYIKAGFQNQVYIISYTFAYNKLT